MENDAINRYLVKVWDVGRNNATEEKNLDHFPAYEDLHGMVRNHLVSSEIDFAVREETPEKVTGSVRVGGWRSVGHFSIERCAG